MEMESTKKRTGLEMEEGNQEEESNDGSRRSTSPEPARKKKKIDPVSDENIVQVSLGNLTPPTQLSICTT